MCLGALVPYKRPDLVVDAFSRLGRPLVVVGDGPELRRLRGRAGPNVTFTGRVADAEVRSLLGRCRALVHAGVEDFGITLVEAQAAGAPVVALAAGGALETVLDPDRDPRSAPTGVLFEEQTSDALVDAVRRLDTRDFDPAALRANAERFRSERFRDGIRRCLAALDIAL